MEATDNSESGNREDGGVFQEVTQRDRSKNLGAQLVAPLNSLSVDVNVLRPGFVTCFESPD
jgi:hypothetical protein